MHRCETDDAMRRSRVGVTAVCNPASRQVQHRLRRRLPYGAARCSAVLNTSPHSCLCVVDMSTEHKFAQSFPCPPPLHSTSATVLALRSGRDQRDLGWAHRGSQTHWRALQGRQRSVRTPSFTIFHSCFFSCRVVRRHSVVLMFLFLVLPFLACVLRCVRKMSSLASHASPQNHRGITNTTTFLLPLGSCPECHVSNVCVCVCVYVHALCVGMLTARSRRVETQRCVWLRAPQ
jgi:hypothetical protein